MSSYAWFALAMLAIVTFSLVVTGNLAAKLNERAKADLGDALEPLAHLINGSKDVEAARVQGSYHGQSVSAAVVSGPGGMGRLFQTTMTGPAGGNPWLGVVRRPRDGVSEWERTFDGPEALDRVLAPTVHKLLDDLLPFPGWFELSYDAATGAFRLTRTMHSRRDIPTAERFTRYLETLASAARENRSVQHDQAPAASATGG